MSKIDLVSRQWCDLVFEGRNKEYGAYRMRANAGKRQLRALMMVLVLVVVVAIGVVVNAAVKALTKNNEETYDAALEMSQLNTTRAQKSLLDKRTKDKNSLTMHKRNMTTKKLRQMKNLPRLKKR